MRKITLKWYNDVRQSYNLDDQTEKNSFHFPRVDLAKANFWDVLVFFITNLQERLPTDNS